MKYFRLIISWLTLFLVFSSCRKVEHIFRPQSPRKKYVQAIKKGPLKNNKIVNQWLASGDSVLTHPISVSIPRQTKMVYFSDEGTAWAWQFSLQEGRTLRAHLSQVDSTQRIFMDLFSLKNGTPQLKKSAGDSLITYQADNNQTLILRVQPELFIDGSATLKITDQPSMAFPVQGGSHADIGGVFGDPRDGGARKHKGVDIFANRGTPALAVASGRVSRTGNHGLGGKQVWLRANGKSIYYAHLDSVKAHAGQKVETGDTLGLVGNTGNARNGPTHLHFGIYDRGAINPQPFIDFAEKEINPIAADPSRFQKWGRISAAKANVRPLPSTKKSPIKSLLRGNAVQVTGATGEWYQVKLPTGQQGFIYQPLVEPATSQLRSREIVSGDLLFNTFTSSKPFFQTNSLLTLNEYGSYQNRKLIKFHGRWLWLKLKF